MAARKRKGARPTRPRASPAPAAKAKVESEDKSAQQRSAPRDLRPYIYAALDLVAVCVWSYLLLFALPNRHSWAAAFLWLMVGLGATMGACMFARGLWGWRAAAAACGLLIAMWLALIVILLMTAGFLAGVYGGFGQAAALGVLGIALLSLQLIALLPAFQLKFLMTRAGRRAFGLGPRESRWS